MLLILARLWADEWRILNVFNYITLRTVLAVLTALIFAFVAFGYSLVKSQKNRAGGAAIWTAIAFKKRRHANDGRRVDFAFYCAIHLALGRFNQQIRLGGVGCNAWFWCHWFL